MNPLTTTHEATFYGETVTGQDAAGTDLTESVELFTESVRFRNASGEWVRESTGERVQSRPTLRVGGHRAGEIEEGQTVELTPDEGQFTVDSVTKNYDQFGAVDVLSVTLTQNAQ